MTRPEPCPCGCAKPPTPKGTCEACGSPRPAALVRVTRDLPSGEEPDTDGLYMLGIAAGVGTFVAMNTSSRTSSSRMIWPMTSSARPRP